MAQKIYIQATTGHAFRDAKLTKPFTCGLRHEGNAVIKNLDGSFTCSQEHSIRLEGKEEEVI